MRHTLVPDSRPPAHECKGWYYRLTPSGNISWPPFWMGVPPEVCQRKSPRKLAPARGVWCAIIWSWVLHGGIYHDANAITILGCLRCYTKLCWAGNAHKCYYETDELPNPRPTQPKKNWVKSGVWATFSHSKRVFRGLGLVLYRKRTTRNLTQPNSLQTPYSQRTSLPWI